jgi:hypothetical protein
MAAAATLNIVAFAQATQSGATTSPSATGATSTAQQDQQVTITGCVQRESDYRRAQSAGAGGAVGTGVGVGNEFILAEASMGSSTSTSSAVGTAGGASTASAGSTKMAYELTGSNEGQVSQYVGQRVEITGKIKPAETGAAGATGGPTAGAPPAGIDVTSKDLKLRELEVTSVRSMTGTCAAK